jgi:excisionase family DNA binding protein
MKKYKVSEIAQLLNINDETVRRWVRSGDLKASKASNKDGNVINEQDLHEFIQTKSKYRMMLRLQESTSNDTYSGYLNDLLIALISERDRLNKRINKIQALLEEL